MTDNLTLRDALEIAMSAMDDRASWIEEEQEVGNDFSEEAEALTAAYLLLKDHLATLKDGER